MSINWDKIKHYLRFMFRSLFISADAVNIDPDIYVYVENGVGFDIPTSHGGYEFLPDIVSQETIGSITHVVVSTDVHRRCEGDKTTLMAYTKYKLYMRAMGVSWLDKNSDSFAIEYKDISVEAANELLKVSMNEFIKLAAVAEATNKANIEAQAILAVYRLFIETTIFRNSDGILEGVDAI